MKKRFAATVGALTLALVASGCASGGSSAGGKNSSTGSITIGVAVSETGAFSTEGKSVRQGYEYWAQKVKDAGGIEVNGTKRPVKMIYYDDQSKPDTAIKLTQRLISEDKVDFLFGPYSSGLTLATSAIAQNYKKIMFAGAASAAAVFSNKNPYVFSPLSITSQYAVSALDLLHNQGVKSVAILHTDEGVMVEADKDTKSYVKKIGMDVVGSETVPADSTDIRGAMRQLKAKNPDALVVYGTTVTGVLVANTMRDLNWTLPTIICPAAGEAAFAKELGKAAEGFAGPSQWEPSVKYKDDFFGSAQEFAAGFKSKFGTSPAYLSASSAAAAYSLQLAVQTAGSTDTEKVSKALKDLDVDTFFGHINFSDINDPSGLTGANVGRPMVGVQIDKDGNRVVIWPKDVATASYQPIKPWSQR